MRNGVRKPLCVAAVPVLGSLIVACTIIGPPSASKTKPTGFGTSSPTAPATASPTSSGGHKATGSPFAGLTKYLAGRHGKVTAAVYDNRTGKTYVLHRAQRQETASIVKVEIMGTAFWNAEQGRPLTSAQRALLVPMIEQSNNTAASDLLKDVGGPARVQLFDQHAGLTKTTVSKKRFIPGSSLPGWGLTLTTALDEVTLVRKFAYANPLLTTANRQRGLNLMGHVDSGQAWGVSGGNYGALPGATVVLKNGWLPHNLTAYTDWQVNSIGWVHGNGRDYVIAVLTNHSASEAYGIQTIDTIARSVYAKLGG